MTEKKDRETDHISQMTANNLFVFVCCVCSKMCYIGVGFVLFITRDIVKRYHFCLCFGMENGSKY